MIRIGCFAHAFFFPGYFFGSVGVLWAAKRVPSAIAGWADVDITPPLGSRLAAVVDPIPVARTILDPLHATVLFLKDSKGTGFVIVSFDLIACA